MTIELGDLGGILLIDDCPIEDADVLLQKLLDDPGVAIDWARCTSAHAAVIQVLLAAGRVPSGVPKNAFLEAIVQPALGRARDASLTLPRRPGDASKVIPSPLPKALQDKNDL